MPALRTKQQRREAFGPSEWVDVLEAAAIRNCSPWKIYKEINDGTLESWRDGGSRKIPRSSAERIPNKSSQFSTPPKDAA
jgi:excisionase family DNA binding protein